jgi:hypothetical protein
VHEVIGHGIAAQMAGVKILAVSAVYVQTATRSRFVAAGVAAFFILGRCRRFATAQYFLWLFGGINLVNSGYLVYSAASGSGDGAVVISSLAPAWLWRVALGIAGVLLYGLAISLATRRLRPFVQTGEVDSRDLPRLVFPAYFSAAVLMLAAAALDPLHQLILLSGIGASLGLNAGLLFVPRFLETETRTGPRGVQSVPFERSWLVLAIIVSIVFLAVLGPGVSP